MKSNSKKGNSDLCYFERGKAVVPKKHIRGTEILAFDRSDGAQCNTMFLNDEGKEEDYYIYEISGLEDDGAD